MLSYSLATNYNAIVALNRGFVSLISNTEIADVK